ncbi:PREDICTED: retrotransposon unclassified [Prunus dulcis]|uniref:PREDICTED: retrotransposon unclassified n=1 Tax=Prunus dulcis TaxID=3755 RepID=A0A5E4GI23_PRUDU|nr:PREDICTED: retrotransposon unclassified [Prunus dulcis]
MYIHVPIRTVKIKPWNLFFNGSKFETSTRASIVLEDPQGVRYAYSFHLDFESTDNRVEYGALIIGLEMLLELNVQYLAIFEDSQLVLRQLTNEYKCKDLDFVAYYVAAKNLCFEFTEVTVEHIAMAKNLVANEMTQVASRIHIKDTESERIIKV